MSNTNTVGCAECESIASGLSRRTVLKGMLGLGAGAVVGSGLVNTRIAYAADGTYTGDTLVVVSLRGGMDGMSAIVPAGDANYYTLRPGIGVPVPATIALDSMFGLHPALAPLKPMWDAKTFAAVHATGLPSPNRSHFAAQAEIEAADPGTLIRTGWLDRLLGLNTPGGPFGAVQIGSTDMPLSLVGPFPTLGMYSVDSFNLNGTNTDADRVNWTNALDSLYSVADPGTAGATSETLGALAEVATLRTAGYTPANGAVYPSSDFGNALSDVARLIKASVGVRVATIDVGNWDMHVGLGSPGSGWMHDNLTDLGAGLAAFATDLRTALDGVTLLTISEFGRRAQENDSGGLDHGWGNVMLALGGGVKGGQVFGKWPTLADAALTDGDLTVTTDYRDVLADVLSNRCTANVAGLAEVFPGWAPTSVGLTSLKA